MGRPRKEERPEPLQGQILEVATALFAERGYAETSLAEIARRVGIRPQSIANHFPSKDLLYDQVVATYYRKLMTDLAATPLDDASLGSDWLAARVADLSVQDRNMLVTLVAEALTAGRGADVIDRELGPVLDLMLAALPTKPDLPTREVLALLILGLVFTLDAPRLPEPTRALRDRLLGPNPRMDEVARLLLGSILPSGLLPPTPGSTERTSPTTAQRHD